jgi:hypothetical protein
MEAHDPARAEKLKGAFTLSQGFAGQLLQILGQIEIVSEVS